MNEPLIRGGYIILSRQLIESDIWEKPPLYLKVWIYLLTRAQHSDYKYLKRGQLRTSIPEIQENCSWYVGFRKITPTKDQIYQVIEWLRTGCAHNDEGNDESNAKATMIATMKATQAIIITIRNYGLYQDSKNYESNDESNDATDAEATMQPSRKQRQPNNINKNGKNDKKKNENKVNNTLFPDEELGVVETEVNIPFKDIIDYLNEKAETTFKPTGKTTREHIQARWNEKFTLQDFFTVIDKKTAEWKGTDMALYLRPITLFGTKFESYLNQKGGPINGYPNKVSGGSPGLQYNEADRENADKQRGW
jgi:uncharacterized phage protein (TIGR02220 family)